jgi:hypothetical protein
LRIKERETHLILHAHDDDDDDDDDDIWPVIIIIIIIIIIIKQLVTFSSNMLRLKHIQSNVVKYQREKISDIEVSFVDIGMTCQYFNDNTYLQCRLLSNFIPVLNCVKFF